MKKYNKVKVKDPSSDGYVVKLFPGQDFELVCTKKDSTDFINATLNSGFLILVDTVDHVDKIVFTFKQKYDMTEWCNTSTTFIGNVKLLKSIDGVLSCVRLCVYCVSSNYIKENVVTVINPDDSLVKIESHQILHVVVFDNLNSNWSVDNPKSLTCVRCETVVSDFMDVYDDESLFCPRPRSQKLPINSSLKDHTKEYFSNEILGSRGLITEYHFWSCLSALDLNKPNGSYSLGLVSICGENGEESTLKTMQVLLGVRGKRKKNINEHFQAIHMLAKCWDERSLSYTRHSILNPRVNENLDVSDSNGWFYIEIPCPQVYHKHLDNGLRWTCDDFTTSQSLIQCCELRSRYLNGKEIQRYLVTGVTGVEKLHLSKLGAVDFYVKENDSYYEISINFWKIPVDTDPLKQSGRYLSSYTEIELEIVNDGKFIEASDIVVLSEVDGKNMGDDYWDYMRDNDFLPSTDSKKKFVPLCLMHFPNTESESEEIMLQRMLIGS